MRAVQRMLAVHRRPWPCWPCWPYRASPDYQGEVLAVGEGTTPWKPVRSTRGLDIGYAKRAMKSSGWANRRSAVLSSRRLARNRGHPPSCRQSMLGQGAERTPRALELNQCRRRDSQDFGDDLVGIGLNPGINARLNHIHLDALLSGDAYSLSVVAERVMRSFASA